MAGLSRLVQRLFSGARGTAFLSAHADDLCLALHRAKLLFPRPHHLVTAFSRSSHVADEYVPRAHEDTAATREDEDRQYAAAAEMRYAGLGFFDLPEIPQRSAAARTELLQGIRGRLVALLRELKPEWVLVPLFWPESSRRHIHHALLCRAAIEALTTLKGPSLGFFDDLIYGRPSVETTIRCRGVDFIPFLIPLCDQELRSKISASHVYQSQSPSRFVAEIMRPAPGGRGRVAEVVRVPRHCRIPPALEEFAGRDDGPVYALPEPMPCSLAAPQDHQRLRINFLAELRL